MAAKQNSVAVLALCMYLSPLASCGDSPVNVRTDLAPGVDEPPAPIGTVDGNSPVEEPRPPVQDVPASVVDVPEPEDVVVRRLLEAPPARDPAAAAASCTALREDRGDQNLVAINRLGLELSSARVEGSIGVPLTDENGLTYAVLSIEKVWVGPTFLEGQQTRVDLDAAEIAGLELPGRYILGFGTMVSGFGADDYPRPRVDDAVSLWKKEVIIPSAERERYADLLEYRVEHLRRMDGSAAEAAVAVVQVVAQDADTGTRLAVLEILSGTLPDVIIANWPLALDVSPPSVGPGQFLATFSSAVIDELSGEHFAGIRDFRPYDASTRALVEHALATPSAPARDEQTLLDAAVQHLRGWVVHRSPVVVTTRISGAAHECCTGAGGTYYSHDVTGDFRGGAELRSLLLGGHGYFSDERCSDARLIALRGVEDAAPVPSRSYFACGEPSEWPSQYSMPVQSVNVRIADSDANRTLVSRWLNSPAPVYSLRREGDTRAPFLLGPDATWSQPMGLEQALLTAELTWINVLGINESTGRIAIDTGFSPRPAEPGKAQRFEIDAGCADPLLSSPGPHLVPLVVDSSSQAAESMTESDAFIIPGVVLPDYEYVRHTARKLRYALSVNERVLAVYREY